MHGGGACMAGACISGVYMEGVLYPDSESIQNVVEMSNKLVMK